MGVIHLPHNIGDEVWVICTDYEAKPVRCKECNQFVKWADNEIKIGKGTIVKLYLTIKSNETSFEWCVNVNGKYIWTSKIYKTQCEAEKEINK